jgi:hypothetical protein
VRNRGVAKTRHSSAEPFNSSTLRGGPKLERKGISWSHISARAGTWWPALAPLRPLRGILFWESSLFLDVPPVSSSNRPHRPRRGLWWLTSASVSWLSPRIPSNIWRHVVAHVLADDVFKPQPAKENIPARSPIPQHRKYGDQKRKRQRKHDQANQVITNHVARDQVSTQRGSQKKNRRHHLLMRKVITCAGGLPVHRGSIAGSSVLSRSAFRNNTYGEVSLFRFTGNSMNDARFASRYTVHVGVPSAGYL